MNLRKTLLLFILIWCTLPKYTACQDPQNLRKFSSSFPDSVPELFAAGFLSSTGYENSLTFTPDFKEIYYTRSSKFPNRGSDIYFTQYISGYWTDPVPATFNSGYPDIAPFISPDGSKLFFASRRPISGDHAEDNWDLWYVKRIGSAWSAPVHLGSGINTKLDESFPSVSNKGNLYFQSGNSAVRIRKIMVSRYENNLYTPAEGLSPTINLESDVRKSFEGHPFIAPDESYILFSSWNRDQDSKGGTDIYVSFFKDGTWSLPKNLGGEVNSVAHENCPRISPDGEYLFFSSYSKAGQRAIILNPGDEKLLNGEPNFYWIRMKNVIEEFVE